MEISGKLLETIYFKSCVYGMSSVSKIESLSCLEENSQVSAIFSVIEFWSYRGLKVLKSCQGLEGKRGPFRASINVDRDRRQGWTLLDFPIMSIIITFWLRGLFRTSLLFYILKIGDKKKIKNNNLRAGKKISIFY